MSKIKSIIHKLDMQKVASQNRPLIVRKMAVTLVKGPNGKQYTMAGAIAAADRLYEMTRAK